MGNTSSFGKHISRLLLNLMINSIFFFPCFSKGWVSGIYFYLVNNINCKFFCSQTYSDDFYWIFLYYQFLYLWVPYRITVRTVFSIPHKCRYSNSFHLTGKNQMSVVYIYFHCMSRVTWIMGRLYILLCYFKNLLIKIECGL